MTRESSDILAEIERTQTRIAELAEAVGSKLDLPAQARDFVLDTKDSLVETADAVREPDASRPPGGRSAPAVSGLRKSLYAAVGTLPFAVRVARGLAERPER
jgi:hypothetical protein